VLRDFKASLNREKGKGGIAYEKAISKHKGLGWASVLALENIYELPE
jgi:hypothetical protein